MTPLGILANCNRPAAGRPASGKWKIIIPRTATRGGSRDNSARRGPRERSAKPPRHSDKQKNLEPRRQPGGQHEKKRGAEKKAPPPMEFWRIGTPAGGQHEKKKGGREKGPPWNSGELGPASMREKGGPRKRTPPRNSGELPRPAAGGGRLQGAFPKGKNPFLHPQFSKISPSGGEIMTA